jgi:hypothetical protein
MNREKFDWHELPVKNVFFGQDKGRPVSTENDRDLHPFMKPLIETVVKRNPTWAFNAYGAVMRRNTICYTYFDVYIGQGKIGTISLGYRGGNDTYGITSPSLEANSGRRRGGTVQSADIKKAAKLVTEHIKPETQAQTSHKAKLALNQLIGGKASEADRDAMRGQKALWPAIRQLLIAEWDTIEPKLRALKAHPAYLDQFIPDLRTLDDMLKLTTKVNNNRGAYIQIDDNGNYVVRKGDLLNVITSDDLYHEERTKLGMLKLCADDTVMPGVGARLNAKTFFIVEGE